MLLIPGPWYFRAVYDVDVSQSLEQLRKLNKDLSNAEFSRAVRLAINDSASQGKTRLVDIIRNEFNAAAFPPNVVRRGIIIKKAVPGNLTAEIYISGKPIPLRHFSPRQTKKGVSVEIFRGDRKVIQSSFFANLKQGEGGIRQVVARGGYENNKFNFRKKRLSPKGPDLPITKLVSVSLQTAWTSERTEAMDELEQYLSAKVPERVAHYIRIIKNKII